MSPIYCFLRGHIPGLATSLECPGFSPPMSYARREGTHHIISIGLQSPHSSLLVVQVLGPLHGRSLKPGYYWQGSFYTSGSSATIFGSTTKCFHFSSSLWNKLLEGMPACCQDVHVPAPVTDHFTSAWAIHKMEPLYPIATAPNKQDFHAFIEY